MKRIIFSVPGVSVAKQSMNVFVGKDGRPHAYPKDKVTIWQNRTALAAATAMLGQDIHGGAVKLAIIFNFHVLKGMERKTLGIKWKDHTTKPDADNLVKAVKDGLKGVIFKDDSQVMNLKVLKRYSEKGDFVEIAVGLVDEYDPAIRDITAKEMLDKD